MLFIATRVTLLVVVYLVQQELMDMRPIAQCAALGLSRLQRVPHRVLLVLQARTHPYLGPPTVRIARSVLFLERPHVRV